MGIEKRTSKDGKVSYRARLRLRRRGEVSATHGRLTDARAWEAKTLAAMGNQQGSATLASQLHTFADAAERYLALLPAMKLKDERNRRRQVEWWRDAIGAVRLSELTSITISAARDRLESTPVPPRAGSKTKTAKLRQPATIVRYLAALSHVFTLAVEWGWQIENPVRNVRKPRQPQGRVRYLTSDELPRLLAACDLSAWRLSNSVGSVAVTPGALQVRYVCPPCFARYSPLKLAAARGDSCAAL